MKRVNGSDHHRPVPRQTAKGQPKPWYLRVVAAKVLDDGTTELDSKGKAVMQRKRPHYASKEEAEADIPAIRAQHDAAGSGTYLFDREAAAKYETAVRLVPEVDGHGQVLA